MIDAVSQPIRRWLIQLFAAAITRTTRAEDRAAALQWLGQSRDIVSSDLGTSEKLSRLNALVDARTVATMVGASVIESVRNYRHADLPLSVKIAVPATLAAFPLVGAQGAGIAAFGSAIGVPVLLLIFLGAAGITAIIETVVSDPSSRSDIAVVIGAILASEHMRRVSAKMKAAMSAEPMDAVRHPMPAEEAALRANLATMHSYAFEQHVMSFFKAAGLIAWATKRSNDMGVDGFAEHPDGLMIVQCKCYAANHKVGRPAVQQFKGVVEEQNATRGFIVTTSSFTDEAAASARLSDKLILIDGDRLVAWHHEAPTFA